MSRMLAVLFTLVMAGASVALAQGGRMGPPPDHWVTADSLSKAVGGDAALAQKVAPHLAAVDKIMKQAADDRAKAFTPGAGPPDQATMEATRTKMQDYQTQIDSHLTMIRDGLDAKQQAAFDAIQKPMVMRRGGMGGGRMGGGGPPQ
ncbi:MAG: hypothetical protein HY700_01450 [Gemmatimonadetes bacterium]|nr:hypothetical protein [Gemmatimonadota bacterium]